MSTDNDKQHKLDELRAAIRRQDEDHEARLVEVTTDIEETTMIDKTDADRMILLDWIAERMPEIDLDSQGVEWETLDDSVEALLVNGDGVDDGSEAMVTTYGEDLHVSPGRWPPLAPAVGLITHPTPLTRRRHREALNAGDLSRRIGRDGEGKDQGHSLGSAPEPLRLSRLVERFETLP